MILIWVGVWAEAVDPKAGMSPKSKMAKQRRDDGYFLMPRSFTGFDQYY
jgi:hypothetical protein